MNKYKVSKERHQLVSWMRLSYFLNIALLSLQIVGIMHYMYLVDRLFIYLVLFDAICLFKWIVSTLPKMVGHKGSSCWLLYTRIFTIKSFIIFFWVLPSKPHSKGVLIKSIGGRSLEIMFLLFITPTIYTIMAFSTGVHLYGGLNLISSERLIHSDMIIHVVFDFLDIIDIFHKFSIDYNSLINSLYFYKLFCGVFLATPIFLHGYSFPCMSGSSNAKISKNLKSDSANDIYFCRKFASIVGIFFVDLPFLFIRIYTWQSTVHYSAFAPFILKNLCFFLLQISRIRHTSIGIESLKFATDAKSNNQAKLSDDPQVRPSSASPDSETIVRTNSSSVEDVTTGEMLIKIMWMLNVDFNSELCHYLDTDLNFSSLFNILLSLPQFIFSLAKFILIILLLKITREDNIQYAVEMLSFRNLGNLFLSTDHLVFRHCFELVLVSSLLIFFIWIILGSFFEALYLSLFLFIRLLSFSYSIIILSHSVESLRILHLLSRYFFGKPIYYIFILFAAKPFTNLLINLYPLLCVFLGKENIYYINPSTFNMSNLKIHENLLFKKNIQDVTKKMVSNDEICHVNLSSFALFINAKEMCCSHSSYSLLVGPNLIKGSRLHFGLFVIHKRKLFVTFLFRMFCLFLTVMGRDEFRLVLLLFALETAMMAFYTFQSCIQRMIAIEAMELQLIANDILKEHRRDEFSMILNEGVYDQITRDNKIYRRFKRHFQMTLPKSLFYLF